MNDLFSIYFKSVIKKEALQQARRQVKTEADCLEVQSQVSGMSSLQKINIDTDK